MINSNSVVAYVALNFPLYLLGTCVPKNLHCEELFSVSAEVMAHSKSLLGIRVYAFSFLQQKNLLSLLWS